MQLEKILCNLKKNGFIFFFVQPQNRRDAAKKKKKKKATFEIRGKLKNNICSYKKYLL